MKRRTFLGVFVGWLLVSISFFSKREAGAGEMPTEKRMPGAHKTKRIKVKRAGGEPYWAYVDIGVADEVSAFYKAGIGTETSCEGDPNEPSIIQLSDGRTVTITKERGEVGRTNFEQKWGYLLRAKYNRG